MAEMSLNEFVRQLRETTTTQELWRVVSAFYGQHGVSQISYHLYRGVTDFDEDNRGTTIVAQGFPEDWVAHYIRHKLFEFDPIPEAARQARLPFFWGDVTELSRPTAQQRALLDEMTEAGVGEGIAINVFGPAMRNAYVGLGFGHKRPDLSSQVLTEMQCVAQMGHLRYCELASAASEKRYDLAPREREILGWVAQGKSNSAIATILDISPHTIDTLVRRVFDKLGVADRTSAAIKAVGTGLILPR